MEYCSLLQEDQWKVKCMSILDRDHCICQDCHKKGIHSTYFPINTINDLEEYFPNALFNGKKLSDYLEDCDWTNNIRTPIRTLSKHIADNIFFSSFETYGHIMTLFQNVKYQKSITGKPLTIVYK